MTFAILIAASLALPIRSHAAGVISVSACGLLAAPNTVYKVTQDLSVCDDSCFTIGADRITLDLQGHTISTCGNSVFGIFGEQLDLVTIKNGSISGFEFGIFITLSSRVSVLGITVSGSEVGIDVIGHQILVKSCVANNNGVGVGVGFSHVQVEQCEASDNVDFGIGVAVDDDALVTRNVANRNGSDGIIVNGPATTVSYNTANDNYGIGIKYFGTRLFTHNTAIGNFGFDREHPGFDFEVECPAEVTYNVSTNGFPASYYLSDPDACHSAHNN